MSAFGKTGALAYEFCLRRPHALCCW